MQKELPMGYTKVVRTVELKAVKMVVLGYLMVGRTAQKKVAQKASTTVILMVDKMVKMMVDW